MAYVNEWSQDIAASLAQSRHSRCCCNTTSFSPCWRCKPVYTVCCLEATFSKLFSRKMIMRGRTISTGSPWWVPGDTCTNAANTNLCGSVHSVFSDVAGGCFQYHLFWSVLDDDCETVRFRLSFTNSASYAATATVLDTTRDWYLSPLVMVDPWYKQMNIDNPSEYPTPLRTISFENCPVPTIVTTCRNEPSSGGVDPEDPPCPPEGMCWPECVVCPSPRESLTATFSEDPSCCFTGTVTLDRYVGIVGDPFFTWYEWEGTLGGPVGTCGTLTKVTVTCGSDTSHITVAVYWVDVNGANQSRSWDAEVACSGGEMESEPLHIDSFLATTGLCEGGSGKGSSVIVTS